MNLAAGGIRRGIDDVASSGSTRLQVTRDVSSQRGQDAECGSTSSLSTVLAYGIEFVLVYMSF